MIAIDSSVVIPWLNGMDAPEATKFSELLTQSEAILPPVTATEVLSDVRGSEMAGPVIARLQVLELQPGYWERAGLL